MEEGKDMKETDKIKNYLNSIKRITFNLPDYSHKFETKIWNRGYHLYHDLEIFEAKAIDETHAYFKVHGTVDYTITLEVKENDIDIQCNCPYEGGLCKHCAAVLMYLEDNPHLEISDEIPSLKFSKEDIKKLEESEREYYEELEMEERRYHRYSDYDDYDEYDDFSMEYNMFTSIVSSEENMERKMMEVCQYIDDFGVSYEIWNFILKAYLYDKKLLEIFAHEMNKRNLFTDVMDALEQYLYLEIDKDIYNKIVEYLEKETD